MTEPTSSPAHPDERLIAPPRWTALALCLATGWVVWPLWPALVLAAWIAHLATPMLRRLTHALGGRSRAAAVISIALVIALLVPIGILVAGTAASARSLATTIAGSASARTALDTLVSGTGADVQELATPSSFGDLIGLLARTGSRGVDVLVGLAGATARLVVGLCVLLGGAYVMLLDGARAWALVRRSLPLRSDHLDRFVAAFHETGRGLLVGFGLTAATQGLVATLCYQALGVPRAWILGPITGLAAIVPLIGTAIVWAPLALGLYLDGAVGRALLLVLLGAALIGTLDNVLRPIYARLGALRMPLYVLFASVFGGLLTFGPAGALLGPLLVRLTIEAISLQSVDDTRNGCAPASPG